MSSKYIILNDDVTDPSDVTSGRLQLKANPVVFPAPKITHITGVGGEVVPLIQPVVLSATLLEW